MSDEQDLQIVEAQSLAERELLYPILEESFEGWYLSHSKRTLRDIEKVYSARLEGKDAGVVMLKKIEPKMGYVYYIAVLPEFRRRKVGSRLLEYSISYFSESGCDVIFASLTLEHGGESKALFLSHGFLETSFGQLSKKYGRLRTINLYRKMLVVSGELVVCKELNDKLG